MPVERPALPIFQCPCLSSHQESDWDEWYSDDSDDQWKIDEYRNDSGCIRCIMQDSISAGPTTAELAEQLSLLWWWASPSWRSEIFFWVTARWKDWKDWKDCEAWLHCAASRFSHAASSRPPRQASGPTRLPCCAKSLNKTPKDAVDLPCSSLFILVQWCSELRNSQGISLYSTQNWPPSLQVCPWPLAVSRTSTTLGAFVSFFHDDPMNALGKEPGGCERRIHVSSKLQHPHRGRDTYLIWHSNAWFSCRIRMRDAWLFMCMSSWR